MNRKAMNAVHNSLRCFSALLHQVESCYGKLAGCCLILVIHFSLAHCCFVCHVVVLSHLPAWHRRNFIELCKTIQLKNSMALTDRLNRLPLKCMEIFQRVLFVDFPSSAGWWGEFWISLDAVVHACCFGGSEKPKNAFLGDVDELLVYLRWLDTTSIHSFIQLLVIFTRHTARSSDSKNKWWNSINENERFNEHETPKTT